MELRIDNQLDEKTEFLIRNIIGAAIDVHRELGPSWPSFGYGGRRKNDFRTKIRQEWYQTNYSK